MPIPDWRELAGPDLIRDVQARIFADDTFAKDAIDDLNAALKKHMDLDFPIPLEVRIVGDGAQVWEKPEWYEAQLAASGGELTDADLDLVSGGGWLNSGVQNCNAASSGCGGSA